MKLLFKLLLCSILFAALTSSCGKDDGGDSKLPKVKTRDMSAIRTRSAVGGGIVESAGASDVTQRGVCWSTNSEPTLLDAFTRDSSGLGGYSSNITGLLPNTQYYLRAYAINNAGISYGNQIVFKTLEEIIPAENFWYVGERPFIVNSLGTLWTPGTRSFGALATESGGIISIFFKSKPTGPETYSVVPATKKDALEDNECAMLVVFPGFGEGLLFSSGKTPGTLTTSLNSFGKIRMNFNDVELEYAEVGEPKTTMTRGILVEK